MQPESPRNRLRNSAAAVREQVGATAAAAGHSCPRVLRLAAGVLLASLLLALVAPARVLATAQPASVTVVGDFQSELGCPGDIQPDCAATQLTYDANDDVWQGTFVFTRPTGSPTTTLR